ncbi:MAG: hypothetical protein IJ209_01245 [Bacteroidaceae bacterium]|nr:hypothetical protein [Bacteroidaceae bacterium]
MKKRYFFSLIAGMLALGAQAQVQYTVLEDVTSKIQNADFKADSPVTGTVTTYDYNHGDVAIGDFCLFGQQAVTGWTANFPSDNTKQLSSDKDPARADGANACAAGIFAFDLDSDTGLGGDYFPRVEGGDTQGLGMVSVWGHNLQYSQSIELPAGAYLLIARLCNVAGTGSVNNNFGFKVDDETYFRSSTNTFATSEELAGQGSDIWVEDTVVVRLKATTEGSVVLGYSFGAGSGSAPHLFVDCVKLLRINEADILKVELNDLIAEGKRLGADTSEAEAVYNNPNATVAQVEAAIEKQKTLNADAVTDLSPFFLSNAHFSEDEPVVGGICTYAKDMSSNGVENFGMLGVKSWVANNPNKDQYASGVYATGSDAFLGGKAFLPPTAMSDGSAGKVLGFVTCWTGAIQYTQHVTLPAGSYTLEISYYNSGGAGAVDKNLIGFIADDGTEYLGTTMSFPVGKWGKEIITFTLDEETEGKFSLGYKSPNVSSNEMPHFFLDGISLFYEGELQFDPSLFALRATVADAENYGGEVFNADLQDELDAAISAARSLISTQSSDADANKAAQDKIIAMLQDVQASIDAYKRLEDFYNVDLNKAQQKYNYIDELSDLDDEVSTALSDRNWDTAKINEVVASLPGIIKPAVQKAWDEAVASGEKLDEPLDISALFDTLGYTYSATAQSGSNVPDKQWSFGSASNFKTQYGTAEVWSQSPFTISQTLADMPAGTYTITTKAFYRVADQASNYDRYISGEELPQAYVFAGHNKTKITNVAELASADEAEFVSKSDVGDGLYVPNSQQAAHDVFENADYADRVIVSAQTALAAQGDLTFGVTADELESNSWVIWYTFEIAYNALDSNVLSEELAALIDEAEEAYGSYEAERVIATGEALETAIGDGQAALDNADIDGMQSAITLLNEALATTVRSNELINQFDQLVVAYGDLITNFEFTSTDTELIQIVEDRSEEQFESNEEIEQLINRLPIAFFNYVVARDDFNDGTEDDPVDLSAVILNNDFEIGNASNWTITADEGSEDGKVGQNQGYQGAEYTNSDDGIIISRFIEAWRPTTDNSENYLNNGTISQTLIGALPAGYYRLEMDGYATHQQAIPDGGIQGVDLYAAYGSTVIASTPVGIDVTSGKPQHFVCDFFSDGQHPVTIGLLVKDTNASWVAADNFQLSYIGQEEPTAVEGIAVTTDAPAAVYNLAGMRVSAAQKGLNIIVRDGKAQKVLVK